MLRAGAPSKKRHVLGRSEIPEGSAPLNQLNTCRAQTQISRYWYLGVTFCRPRRISRFVWEVPSRRIGPDSGPTLRLQVGGRHRLAPNLYGHSIGSTHDRLAGHAVRATQNLVSSAVFLVWARRALPLPFCFWQFSARGVGFLRRAEALVDHGGERRLCEHVWIYPCMQCVEIVCNAMMVFSIYEEIILMMEAIFYSHTASESLHVRWTSRPHCTD
jgi:hypothetical protein